MIEKHRMSPQLLMKHIGFAVGITTHKSLQLAVPFIRVFE